MQLIPARGRKRTSLHSGRSDSSITTHPRKGTETVSCNRATYTRFDYNLSPQGDGNTQKVLHASWIVLLQLIPARGRKLVVIVDEVGFLGLQLIPVRGRKRRALCPESHALLLQLIPARGRKHLCQLVIAQRADITTHPRKTLSGAARQLSRRESLVQGNGSCKSSPRRGSWHGVSRD